MSFYVDYYFGIIINLKNILNSKDLLLLSQYSTYDKKFNVNEKKLRYSNLPQVLEQFQALDTEQGIQLFIGTYLGSNQLYGGLSGGGTLNDANWIEKTLTLNKEQERENIKQSILKLNKLLNTKIPWVEPYFFSLARTG